MARYNDGKIYSDEKCVGCNKCIAVCPVMGANVSVINNVKNRVEVSKKCIQCGACIQSCPQNARAYKDDLNLFFEDLTNNKDISLYVDDALYLNYGDYAYNILGYLKNMGVKRIYNISFGGDISILGHVKYLKEKNKENKDCNRNIANTCYAVLNYAEISKPVLLNHIIPVMDPLSSTITYAKKYLMDSSKVAVISPCVSNNYEKEKSEIKPDYNITIRSLIDYFEGRDISEFVSKPSLKSKGAGGLLSISNGFREAVSCFFPKSKMIIGCDDNINCIDDLLDIINDKNDEESPFLITINACQHGCIWGNGVDTNSIVKNNSLKAYNKKRISFYEDLDNEQDCDELYNNVMKNFADINFDDFRMNFNESYKQPHVIPEYTILKIFSEMHKTTVEKQNMNCCSCGYSSCREMAIAVANGYSKMQNCIHYMNDDIQTKSYMDLQLGITNSRGFYLKAMEYLQENPDKEHIVIYANLNKLRNINELYGNDTGDKVLQFITKTFTDFISDQGVLARMAGSIFAMVFEYSDEIMENFTALKFFDCAHLGVDYPVSMRFGMVRSSECNETISRMVDMAAFAADKSRDRTKNTYNYFTKEMRDGLDLETKVTGEMRRAMEDGEYVLYLQPQYNHVTGELVGAETLSRWIKNDGTVISPGVFIPIFEKNGFIKDMDKYVWESAFKLVKSWEDEGIDYVPISINISRISMGDDEIINVLKKLDDKYQVDKKYVHFEITESAYMENQKMIAERTQKIKDLGFDIAMDDFGTGYSSLNSLKDIPLDILKLDMGFIRGNSNSQRGAGIIGHMINMAHSLDLVTVAEGVETKEQADLLTEMGCDVIQGYFYAKPLPVVEYEAILKSRIKN